MYKKKNSFKFRLMIINNRLSIYRIIIMNKKSNKNSLFNNYNNKQNKWNNKISNNNNL